VSERRVTVRLDGSGGITGVEVEGQLDPEEFIEETPGKPALLATEDETGVMRFSSGR